MHPGYPKKHLYNLQKRFGNKFYYPKPKYSLSHFLKDTIAKRTAHINGLAEKATFVTGSIYSLSVVEDDSVDAVILFNIVDNMIPRDAHALLDEIKRIIKPEGRVLMKVNDRFREPNLIEDDEYEALGNGFYREASGLFLWNLSNDDIKSLVGPELEIEQSSIVEFKQYNARNRLFFLRSQCQ